MPQRINYCSPDWFVMLGELAQEALDDAGVAVDGKRFSLLERYRDAPAEFRPSPALFAGFRIDVDGRRATARAGAADGETADLVLEISWEGANRIAGSVSGPDLDALMAVLMKNGDLVVEGALDDFPADINAFHDAVQTRTRTYFG
ncbi:MAG: hypothetical protein O2910_04855 [Proteobacteria bacterium]|jgi:hypothetical protein|nr:hypothetical protein [Pseudomonadota bacterium]